MADELIEIADAVVSELNDNDWLLAFEAERLYVPETELDTFQPGEMHVTVVPRGRVRESASRGRSQVDYTIQVIFQQKLEENTDDVIARSVEDQCDELIEFVQEVADHFDKVGGEPLAEYTDAKGLAIGIVNEPAYDQKMIEENRLFESVLVLGYRTWRDKRT